MRLSCPSAPWQPRACGKVAPHGPACGYRFTVPARCHNGRVTPRFLTLADVQEILNISQPQAYALVRSGELPAIQVGGRGQWRIESVELEAYIARQYEATRARVSADGTDGAFVTRPSESV